MHADGEENVVKQAKDAPGRQLNRHHATGPELQSGTPVRTEKLNAYYGKQHAIKDIDLAFEPHKITALIGPSGCGKSTLLRTLNRLHEVVPGARSEGKIFIGSENILARQVNLVQLRRRVGMVFQKPNPFSTLSIRENVIAGLRLEGENDADTLQRRVEDSLRRAYLWEEVKEKLDDPAAALSGGQQQRLCIARTIALEPEVILLDEPCSALDPVATRQIEELMQELKQHFTLILVTHNLQQARRVSHKTAFMLAGEERTGALIEYDDTRAIFEHAKDERTRDYVRGRIG